MAAVHGEPVELELVDGVPQRHARRLREAAARARAQQQAEQTMTSDPVVRELMSQFKTARIVPGSIKPVAKEPHTMMKNQLAGLMKQAQAMQDNLRKAQEELATIEVEGQAGAGLVKVTMTCRHDVKRVSIDPSLLGRRQGHARRPGGRRLQRRRSAAPRPRRRRRWASSPPACRRFPA